MRQFLHAGVQLHPPVWIHHVSESGFMIISCSCSVGFSMEHFKSELQLLLSYQCIRVLAASRLACLNSVSTQTCFPSDSVSSVFVARPPILTLLQVNEAGCVWAFPKRHRYSVSGVVGGKPPEFQCGDSELLMFCGIWSSASLGQNLRTYFLLNLSFFQAGFINRHGIDVFIAVWPSKAAEMQTKSWWGFSRRSYFETL